MCPVADKEISYISVVALYHREMTGEGQHVDDIADLLVEGVITTDADTPGKW